MLKMQWNVDAQGRRVCVWVQVVRGVTTATVLPLVRARREPQALAEPELPRLLAA